MSGLNTKPYCLLNGKFLKENDAKISVNDIGLHRGYGVFEVLRTYNRKPFLLKEHLDRLFSSAAEIDLKVPYNRTEISTYTYKLLNKNKYKESLIKILVTGGVSNDGMTPNNKPTFLILTKNLKPTKKEVYENGVKLITYEHERFMPSAKTLNYIHLMKSFKKLKKEKAFTLLYVSKGRVLEGATCNIFMFKNNALITPDDGVLNGITRNLTLQLAKKHFSIQQRKVSLSELLKSDEVFVTLTTKGIVPIVKIDNFKIGKGIPGNKTKQMIGLLEEYIENFV